MSLLGQRGNIQGIYILPMSDIASMKILQSKDEFSNVVASPVEGESTQRLHQCSAISSVQILHHQIKVLLALEREVEFDNVGRAGLVHENGPLGFHVRDLVLGDHVRLLERFDGVVVSGRNLLREIDGSESTSTDRLDNLKVLDGGGRRFGRDCASTCC